jgi:hypothetical protein
VLSLAKLYSGQQKYYEDAVARGLDESYAGVGERPRQWIGRGAEVLHVSGELGGEALNAILDGRTPTTGARLTDHTPKVIGYDATFCAPKSVSLLCALGSPEVARERRRPPTRIGDRLRPHRGAGRPRRHCPRRLRRARGLHLPGAPRPRRSGGRRGRRLRRRCLSSTAVAGPAIRTFTPMSGSPIPRAPPPMAGGPHSTAACSSRGRSPSAISTRRPSGRSWPDALASSGDRCATASPTSPPSRATSFAPSRDGGRNRVSARRPRSPRPGLKRYGTIFQGRRFQDPHTMPRTRLSDTLPSSTYGMVCGGTPNQL